jgi:hypothetical protein
MKQDFAGCSRCNGAVMYNKALLALREAGIDVNAALGQEIPKRPYPISEDEGYVAAIDRYLEPLKAAVGHANMAVAMQVPLNGEKDGIFRIVKGLYEQLNLQGGERVPFREHIAAMRNMVGELSDMIESLPFTEGYENTYAAHMKGISEKLEAMAAYHRASSI